MNLKVILGDTYKDGMTFEEVSAALADKEYIDKAELLKYVPKETADKFSSEATDWKRKHNALLSDEEKRTAEREEIDAKLKADYDALLKKTTTAEHKAKFLALGYSETLAEQTAAALVGSDFETVFKNQGLFNAEMEKTLKVKALADTPKPPAGADPNGTIGTSQAQRINSRYEVKV